MPVEISARPFGFSRRNILHLLLGSTALAVFRPRPVSTGELVEVDGWILRKSDLA